MVVVMQPGLGIEVLAREPEPNSQSISRYEIPIPYNFFRNNFKVFVTTVFA